MFGTPATAVDKLKRYRDLGVTEFIYYASMGLGHDQQKRSLIPFGMGHRNHGRFRDTRATDGLVFQGN